MRLPFVSTTSLASQTQPTLAWIAFSITHGEGSDTESDPHWGWLGLACETIQLQAQWRWNWWWLYRSPCCVTPCVSDNGSHRCVNTAATLQAVYLVWLFLRITTTYNLPIIGLVRKGFPESLTHAQTVDTRPLFPPPTWPGYEARRALQILWQTI